MRGALVIGAVLAAAVGPAAAQDSLPDITDRDFTLDLHRGIALGSGEIVGTGGAGVSNQFGTSGMLSNPAALGVRPPTSNDNFEWDWHIDWLNPDLGSDRDNNGFSGDSSSFVLTGGLGFLYNEWGVGLTVTSNRLRDGNFDAQTVDAQLILTYALWKDQLIVGGGFRFGSLEFLSGGQKLFQQSGATLTGGVVFKPFKQNFRLGAALSFPVAGENVDVEDCDPMNCEGYILPNKVMLPLDVRLGASYYFGESTWNAQVASEYKDERRVVLAFDVRLAGKVDNGAGLGAFINQKLQRSGQSLTPSFHIGADSELIPGWLRVRLGSYYEGARVGGVSGRFHGTGGLDVRLLQFHLWGSTYRLRASGTIDIARRYGNYAVSIGFWH